MAKTEEALDQNKALLGVLALLAADREDRLSDEGPRKTEVILASAGFQPNEIGPLVGKTNNAVAKTIRRERAKKKPKRKAK